MLFRIKFLSFFQILSVKCWDVAEKFLDALSKLKITDPRDEILSHFLMFDDPFCQLPSFSRAFSESLSKLLSSSLEDRFESKRFFRTKKCFLNFFRVRAKQFEIFDKKSARKPNICSISPEEYFEENNVVKKRILLSFSDSERKTLGSCPKNF